MKKTYRLRIRQNTFTPSNLLQKEITYVDLFCGLGAFHSAFDSVSTEQKKYKCVFACDIDENVRKLYKANYGMEPAGDINGVDISKMPAFDVLCAGFPCQPYSISGNKNGFEDEKRGNLFFSILKIVDGKTPNTIILENVKNLHTIHGGAVFATIKSELEKRGYFVCYKIINSKFYHCPQARQRIFIVGQKSRPYEFLADPSNEITAVSTILDKSETRFLDYSSKYRLEAVGPVGGEVVREDSCRMLYKVIHKTSGKGGRQGERVYSIDSCGPTICASSGGPGAKTGLYYIDNKVRRLNAKEGLKMFGYDDAYNWTNIVKEEDMLFYLGNSIVVNVAKAVVSNL
jgi:DNA (cytosine-5)-methyltransferase 1